MKGRHLVQPALLVALGSACSPVEEDDNLSFRSDVEAEPEGGTGGEILPGEEEPYLGEAVDAPEVVAYEKIVRGAGDEAVVEERGEFDEELRKRVASPDRFLEEGVIYDETAWYYDQNEDGQPEQGYRITVVSTDPPVPEPQEPANEFLTDELAGAMSTVDAAERIRVLIEVETDLNHGDLPLLPPRGAVSIEAYDAALAERADAFAQLQSDFEQGTAAIRDYVQAEGGVLEGSHPRSGWLAARLPADAVSGLDAFVNVRRVALNAEPVQHAGRSLGELRTSAFTDMESFEDAGFDGENGSDPPLLVGVTEVNGIEDEACFTDDTGFDGDECDTNERLLARFDCGSGSGCSSVSDFSTSDESFHGTIVSSILLGDYNQSQGDGSPFNLGSGLPAGWEDDASGFAAEANLHYYTFAGGGESGMADSLDCAQGVLSGCTEVDVHNNSNGYLSGCNPDNSTVSQDETELLHDDGVLPVVSAGNSGGNPSLTACTVNRPADLPKAFTVGGLESTSTGPQTSWTRMSEGSIISSRGGASIESPNGTLRSGTMSLVDLAAAGRDVEFVTRDDGTYGTIVPNYTGDGTSFAAPQVAGAAIAVKDWMLANGNTWIGSPGRLFAVMLAMGDRRTDGTGSATVSACVSGSRIMCGADEIYGLGRMKLRRFGDSDLAPAAWVVNTRTITSSTSDPLKQILLSTPVSSAIDMVKCVMFQQEDMLYKDNISNIGLWVRVRDKPAGGCAVDTGTLRYTRYEAQYDVKHMVTILDSEVDLSNKCIQVEYDRRYLSSLGSVTVTSMCYYASTRDDSW